MSLKLQDLIAGYSPYTEVDGRRVYESQDVFELCRMHAAAKIGEVLDEILGHHAYSGSLDEDERKQIEELKQAYIASISSEGKETIQKWEYDILEGTVRSLMRKLREKGEEGWELCSMDRPVNYGVSSGEIQMILKRPKQS